MSTNNSSDDEDFIYRGGHCNCMLSDDDSCDTDTDNYAGSLTEDLSSDISGYYFEKKRCYIATYNDKIKKGTTIICYFEDILNYRNKLKKLSKKSTKSINDIWLETRVYIPKKGHISLKSYIASLNKEKNNSAKPNEKIAKDSSNKTKPAATTQADKVNSADSTVKDNVKSNINDNINNNIKSNINNDIKINTNNNFKSNNNISLTINDKTVETDKQKSQKKEKTKKSEPKKPCAEKIIESVTRQSTGTNTFNTPENNTNLNSAELQNSKKKLKKQKQKEKKLERQRDLSNSSSTKLSKKETNKFENKNMEKKVKVADLISNQSPEEIMTDDIINTDDENLAQLLSDTEEIPAFYVELFKRKQKYLKNPAKETPPPSPTSFSKRKKESNISSGSDDEFIIKSGKRHRKTETSKQLNISESDEYGEKAIDIISKNSFTKAINYLTKALSYNTSDYRHYLNRSYCYLRMGKYPYALADVQQVIKNSKNNGYLFIANLRAGQASFAIKKLQQAEAYLKEALRLYPNSPHARRELMRVQITRIVDSGYTESYALFALELNPSTGEAIKFLEEINTPKNNQIKNIIINYDDEYDNQVYESDEESNTENLNKLLNYNPGDVKLRHIAQPFLSWFQNGDKKLNLIKMSPIKNKPLINGKNIQVTPTAIWVGSLTPYTTDTILKKTFKQYGNIISIHHPEGKGFCFINYEKHEDASKVLSTTQGKICVNGCNLIIRAATRKD